MPLSCIKLLGGKAVLTASTTQLMSADWMSAIQAVNPYLAVLTQLWLVKWNDAVCRVPTVQAAAAAAAGQGGESEQVWAGVHELKCIKAWTQLSHITSKQYDI
jgi:hypothetical protein